MISAGFDARPEQEVFDELRCLCGSPGYMHALAYFCYRDNTLRIGEELTADDVVELHSESRLIRTEISTLIGLALCSSVDWSHPGPENLQEYIDRTDVLMEELHKAISKAFFDGATPEKIISGEFDPFKSAAALREPIFYGGESAYSFQYRDLAPKKYERDEEWILAHKGFSLESAARVISSILEILNEKQLSTIESFKTMDPEHWTVLPAYTFTIEDVSRKTEIDESVVSKVIAAFSFPDGSLNEGFRSLNDFNVANAAPIICAANGEFVLLQHYSLVESFYESPIFWLSSDKDYAKFALSNRGLFTEVASRDFLERVFESNHVFTNVDIYKGKKTKVGEIDVLVVFGDRYIVLQAKSKRLTIEARKGNDLQIKDDFKKAVHDAYDQAIICSKALIDGDCRYVLSSGEELTLKHSPKIVYPLCIVSDHYPALNFQARQFLIIQEHERIAPPVVTDLFALDTMTEMLRSPLRFLSYLSLRAEHGGKVHAMHELTILGYHLKRNLWLDDMNGMVVIGDDVGSELDVAMMVRRDGLPGRDTPEGILTRHVNSAAGRMISQIEKMSDPATLDLGMLLLEAGEDAFTEFSSGLEHIVDQTKKDAGEHDVTIGLGGAGVTVHCNYLSRDEAADKLTAHCKARKYAERANAWHGVAVSPKDGSIRFGCEYSYPWVHDEHMEGVLQSLGLKKGKKIQPPKNKKVGRNDPCPCGSGLKFKKCCLKKQS